MQPIAPLAGIRVLDFSKILAGPLCTQYLGDLGAEVVKVEPCGSGDDTRRWPPYTGGEGTVFQSVNRNKRSIGIDLKSAHGQAICRRLAARSDVVVETFGPGVATRLGIDYDQLAAVNPALVYCSISGYGTVGPMREGKGYDVVLQAWSGMLSITGEPDRPPVRSPFSPVDQGAGLNAVIAILAALFERSRTGRGAKVESSLFDSAVGFLGYFLQGYWARGTEPQRAGSGHESLCPYQVFATRDKPVILGVANDALWHAFCDVAGAPDLARMPQFATNADRVEHRAETVAAVTALMMCRGRSEWLAALGAAGVPCSPVHSFGEMLAHPHTGASDMIFDYADGGAAQKGVAPPIRIDGERPGERRRPPARAAQTAEVLRDAGYSDAEVAAFAAAGVVEVR